MRVKPRILLLIPPLFLALNFVAISTWSIKSHFLLASRINAFNRKWLQAFGRNQKWEMFTNPRTTLNFVEFQITCRSGGVYHWQPDIKEDFARKIFRDNLLNPKYHNLRIDVCRYVARVVPPRGEQAVNVQILRRWKPIPNIGVADVAPWSIEKLFSYRVISEDLQ